MIASAEGRYLPERARAALIRGSLLAERAKRLQPLEG